MQTSAHLSRYSATFRCTEKAKGRLTTGGHNAATCGNSALSWGKLLALEIRGFPSLTHVGFGFVGFLRLDKPIGFLLFATTTTQFSELHHKTR
jgi:hypothetical protein